MKKIFLLFVTLLSAFFIKAQVNDLEKAEALQLVSANQSALGLSADDMNNLIVASTYKNKFAGTVMVYLQQTYKGIPVHNQIHVLAFKNGQVVSNAGGRISGIENIANVNSGTPAISAEAAVQSAISDRKLNPTEMAVALNRKDNGRKIEFGKLGVSRENITAQLMWFPIEGAKLRVKLGWQVYIVQTTSSDYWLVRVDATDNSILGMDNLTVYCNWDSPDTKNKHDHPHRDLDKIANTNFKGNNLFDFKKIAELNSEVPNSPSIVNGASYRVVAYPAESPIHPGGAPQLVNDPWNLSGAGNNATTLKWHSIGATNYDITRGNNVWAQEDRNGNNGTSAAQVTSTTTPDPLTFNFIPDFTVDPTQTAPVQNQQFNVTNLFYWNNIIHDLTYQYGFDEAARNFQGDNLGRGGVGNDFVFADAQDGIGSNNANFATPADGGNPRMQMFLWTAPNPDIDGDVDNGIIVHEYGHGISNRLTGVGIGCLGNQEQMGEGWSDYYSLMYTQNWATATLATGFNSPRGIGTYALNQPITGPGIRPARYCTDFAVNNFTYSNLPGLAVPHGVGFLWCTIIWDMTWNIINQNGTINPNLFNPAGGGGNTIALKLVTEAMKLQPCNPGFVDGRNAILQADMILYGGTYQCAIKEAFRRRGLGDGASQGSSGSISDGVVSFILNPSLSLTTGVTAVPEQQNINYSNRVNSNCGAVAGYTLRDTLPMNVTHVSGGTYDPATRVVSFPVTQAVGQTINYNFVANINAGAYFPPATLLNEPVPATMPATWTPVTTVPAGGGLWTVSTAQTNSAPNAFFVLNEAIATDKRLELTTGIALPAGSNPTLSFWHRFNTESGWDGGVVEISTNGGSTWTDLGPNMVTNGYNGTLGAGVGNNLSNRSAFTGTIPAFINTTIRLSSFAGQTVKIRFRFGSDDNTAGTGLPTGWFVDDISITNTAVVNMRASLFNASNVRVMFADTVTIILPPVTGCTIPSITTQPTNTTTCPASNASFTVAATGTAPLTYQWQESTNGGGTWTNITNGGIYSGATTTTLTLTGVTAGMNNYQYRAVVAGCSPPNATSNGAVLTVANSVGGTVNPANTSVCGVTNSGTLTLSGHTGNVVRWEFSTNGGASWTNVANNSTTYSYTNLTQTTQFRAFVQVGTCTGAYSSIATVTFIPSTPLLILADPGTTICQGDPTRLTVVEQSVQTFTSACGSIAIPGTGTSGIANPYPCNLVVSGLPTSGVTVQSVILNGMSHTFPDDVDILLQSPTGVNVVLMSDVGGSVDINGVTYTFRDGSPAMADGALNPTGTYRPTNFVATDNYIAPGPGSVNQANPLLSTFTGDLNGTWKLFVVDDLGGDIGSISGGYTINFASQSPVIGGTFLWTPAAGLSSTTTNPVAASPSTTTTYSVFHNNGIGCTRQANITITVLPLPAVTTQPSNVTVCAGSTATFTAAGVGAGLTYQWQVSTDNGVTYTNLANGAPYSGVTTATLTVNPTTLAMNNYRFRVALSGTCPPPAFSNGAILTVIALPVVTVTPSGTVCGGVAGVSGTLLTASGANTYTWSPAAGLYTNPTATIPYVAGAQTPIVYAAPTVFTAYTVTGTNTTTGCSATATVLVNYTPPAPTITPVSVTMCLGDPAVKLKSSSSQSFSSTFSSGAVNITIPDGPGLPPVPASYPATTSNITVSGIPANGTITNIRARFNITHDWVSDLVMVLKAPNGNVFNLDALLNRTNNPGANFTNTVISSAGTTLLSAGAAPYTGTFRPDAAGATFTALGFTFPGGPAGFIPNVANFNGLYATPNGAWTLAMYDAGAPDAGVLNNWSLEIDYIVGVPATPAVWSPIAGLFTDPAATVAYAGQPIDSVYARPTPSGVYPYTARVNSMPPAPARPATNFAPGNGNSTITFNVRNNNGYPVTLSSIDSRTFAAGATNVSAYFKPSPINGAPGAISVANGWNQFGSASITGTGTGVQPFMSGLNLVIPAGATYGIALQAITPAGGFNLSYATIAAGTYTFSDGGCDIVTGSNIGYGGVNVPAAPTFVPRGFIGSVGFTASIPTCTSPARTVIVTVNDRAVITNEPVNAVICTDKSASFTVTATGTAPLTYRWQQSVDNGNNFTNIANGGVFSGATTATLTITNPPVSMNGNLFRVIVQGALPCPPDTSLVRSLTVNPLPTIVINASPYTRLFPGLTTTLFSTVTPAAATYMWLRNGVAVPGGTGSSILVDIDGLGTYSLRVTDVNGCSNISNQITISDSLSGRVFIYPNPTSGRFQVRYYSTTSNVLARGLTIYDAKGARVMVQTYTINAPFGRMDVDMSKFGKGVYWVELGDANFNRLAIGRVVIQ